MKKTLVLALFSSFIANAAINLDMDVTVCHKVANKEQCRHVSTTVNLDQNFCCTVPYEEYIFNIVGKEYKGGITLTTEILEIQGGNQRLLAKPVVKVDWGKIATIVVNQRTKTGGAEHLEISMLARGHTE